MAPATLFGLALIGAGIFLAAVSPFLTNKAASSQAYLRPGLDQDAFKHRNVRGLRWIAGVWVVVGAAIAIFGLVKGP
jgi:hypothetical protein